jgi:hypothetical protein
MAGFDVVVHFDNKEIADEFARYLQSEDNVRVGYERYLPATYVETLECPR